MFSIELKVHGFTTIDSDGRRRYTKGCVLKWDVEYGSLSLDLLMLSLSSEVRWGEQQTATVWFLDKGSNEDVRIVHESQLVDMFEMYKSEMHAELMVLVVESVLCDASANNIEPTSMPLCVLPLTQTGQGASASKVAVSGEPATQEADETLPNVFDMEEEYVGVDDEGIYIQPIHTIPPTDHAETSGQPSAENAEPCAENAEPGGPSGTAQPHGEVEVTDDDPAEFNVLHNPEMPVIKEEAVFPDMITFRKAIRHFAVVTGFELSNLQTDPTRFIAHCKHEGCKWRIHASRLSDGKTIQVCMSICTFVSILLESCDL